MYIPGELLTFAVTNTHHNYLTTLQCKNESYDSLQNTNLPYSTLCIILARSCVVPCLATLATAS